MTEPDFDNAQQEIAYLRRDRAAALADAKRLRGLLESAAFAMSNYRECSSEECRCTLNVALKALRAELAGGGET